MILVLLHKQSQSIILIMLANSYLHQLDPFAIQITETFGLRWYGLAYITAFLIAWSIVRWMGKQKLSPIQPDRASDFIFAGVLGVLIGGRLGYCVFYDPSLLYTFTDSFPWWRALAIQDGGMASHGGMVGVFIAFVVWGRKNKISVLHLLDIGAFIATPGLFLGRLANFINGELWGKQIPEQMRSDPPAWSVKYPTEITEVWAQNPTGFEASLQSLEPLRTTISGGNSFYQSVVQEMYAGNNEVISFVQPQLTAWYPSQLFQAFAEGPFLFCVLLVIWWSPRNPGVIASSFLLFYGVGRIVTEMFRQPDEGVAIIAGLSRGQLLSVSMVVTGTTLVLLSTKLNTTKLGGFKNTL